MRFVSILGDSISTYEGYNPEGYSVYYYGPWLYQNEMTSVYDTWWAKTNQALRAYLCINNSFSGSRVTGGQFPSASSRERTSALHKEPYSPDIILVYIGFNDFGGGVPVVDNTTKHLNQNDLDFFEDAYDHMLSSIKANYPDAKIICGTLMRTVLQRDTHWVFPERYQGVVFEEYNEAIRRSCSRANCYLADLSALNLRYETLDGTHPTVKGHSVIYQAWVSCLKKLGFLG